MTPDCLESKANWPEENQTDTITGVAAPGCLDTSLGHVPTSLPTIEMPGGICRLSQPMGLYIDMADGPLLGTYSLTQQGGVS